VRCCCRVVLLPTRCCCRRGAVADAVLLQSGAVAEWCCCRVVLSQPGRGGRIQHGRESAVDRDTGCPVCGEQHRAGEKQRPGLAMKDYSEPPLSALICLSTHRFHLPVHSCCLHLGCPPCCSQRWLSGVLHSLGCPLCCSQRWLSHGIADPAVRYCTWLAVPRCCSLCCEPGCNAVSTPPRCGAGAGAGLHSTVTPATLSARPDSPRDRHGSDSPSTSGRPDSPLRCRRGLTPSVDQHTGFPTVRNRTQPFSRAMRVPLDAVEGLTGHTLSTSHGLHAHCTTGQSLLLHSHGPYTEQHSTGVSPLL
jgi:hypothetical protein